MTPSLKKIEGVVAQKAQNYFLTLVIGIILDKIYNLPIVLKIMQSINHWTTGFWIW